MKVWWVTCWTRFSEDEERTFEVEAPSLALAWEKATRQILEGREKIISVEEEK
jgi:hypothetical protein